MNQYPIQHYRQSQVRAVSPPVSGLIKQVAQHPGQASLATSIVVGAAAKGFGAPAWLSVLIGLGTAYFVHEGLKRANLHATPA